EEEGPIYYRLEKDDVTVTPGLRGRFETGRVQVIAEGGDCLLLSMGGISAEASAACAALQMRGIVCTHAVIADVHPAPREHLAELLGKHGIVCTVEAHYTSGGIGSLVAELIAEAGLPCRLLRLGFASMPDGRIGPQSHLLAKHGLDAMGIAAAVESGVSSGWIQQS
ncbi:MAG: transketolase C-terminal domain-containing protein, partial [Chthoniobacterales bacterium]